MSVPAEMCFDTGAAQFEGAPQLNLPNPPDGWAVRYSDPFETIVLQHWVPTTFGVFELHLGVRKMAPPAVLVR